MSLLPHLKKKKHISSFTHIILVLCKFTDNLSSFTQKQTFFFFFLPIISKSAICSLFQVTFKNYTENRIGLEQLELLLLLLLIFFPY